MVVIGAGISATVGGKDPLPTPEEVLGFDGSNGTLSPTPFLTEQNVTTMLPEPVTEAPTLSPTTFFKYEPPLDDYCLQFTQQQRQQQPQDSWWISHRDNALQRSIELVLDVKLLNSEPPSTPSSDTLLKVVEQITSAMNQYMVPLLVGCRSLKPEEEEKDRSAYAIDNASVVHGHPSPSFQNNVNNYNDMQQQEAPNNKEEMIHRVILTIHCLLKGHEDNDWVLQKINSILKDQDQQQEEEDLMNKLNLTDLKSLSVVDLLPTRAASLKSILGSELQKLMAENRFRLHPQAFYWLAELDSWKMAQVEQETSDTWISRYVLAIVFYENVFVGDVVNQTDNGTSRFATWLSSTESVCQWSGVDCDSEGVLTRVYLDYDELTGHLPSEIGLLTHLTYLNFYENNLGGPIPTEIGRLTSLRSIFLDGNMLTGEIPSHFG